MQLGGESVPVWFNHSKRQLFSKINKDVTWATLNNTCDSIGSKNVTIKGLQSMWLKMQTKLKNSVILAWYAKSQNFDRPAEFAYFAYYMWSWYINALYHQQYREYSQKEQDMVVKQSKIIQIWRISSSRSNSSAIEWQTRLKLWKILEFAY